MEFLSYSVRGSYRIRLFVGTDADISNSVIIGSHVKIQNNVSVYEGVELEDGVFCGPSCVFTNDLTPRAEYPKGHAGYKKTLVRHGASIGANATVVCGQTIGDYAMVAAGAVVAGNVLVHIRGCVPAKQIGWVCTCGQKSAEISIVKNVEEVSV